MWGCVSWWDLVAAVLNVTISVTRAFLQDDPLVSDMGKTCWFLQMKLLFVSFHFKDYFRYIEIATVVLHYVAIYDRQFKQLV